MRVKDLIKQLKKMPQNESVGIMFGDYQEGNSDPVSGVRVVDDNDCANEGNKAKHRVVIDS